MEVREVEKYQGSEDNLFYRIIVLVKCHHLFLCGELGRDGPCCQGDVGLPVNGPVLWR